MKLLFKIIGILIILIALILLIKPEYIFGWMENNIMDSTVYIAAIVSRLILGVLLIIAAKRSNFPMVIKIIGYLAVITAIVFLIIGQNRFQEFVLNMIPNLQAYAPMIGIIAVLLGGFLFYAFTEKRLKS